MRYLALFLALTLTAACKPSKPLPVDTLPPHAVLLALDTLGQHDVIHKPTFLSRLFGGGGKVKLKGVTLNVNTQTASHGSTIGANAQAGNDESKVKGSAVSSATAANTGGQGAQVSGDASATASNTPQSSVLKYVLIAFAGGFLLRHFGPVLIGLGKKVFWPA